MLELLLHLAFTLVLGSMVGFVGALLGLGGGFILVPLLITLFGFDAHQAVGTSIAAVMFTGASSAFAYFKQRRLDWRLAVIAESTTMPGGLTGAYLTTFISSSGLRMLFAFLLLGLAFSMIVRKEDGKDHSGKQPITSHKFSWKRRLKDSYGRVFEYSVNLPKLLSASYFAGVISGFFGIGGGTLKVPILYHLGVPVHVAIATSTLMITLTAFSGTLGHLMLQHIRWIELMGIVPGIVVGARFGAATARRIASKTLRKIFSAALIFMALILLVR